jgi:hypothetical protein
MQLQSGVGRGSAQLARSGAAGGNAARWSHPCWSCAAAVPPVCLKLAGGLRLLPRGSGASRAHSRQRIESSLAELARQHADETATAPMAPHLSLARPGPAPRRAGAPAEMCQMCCGVAPLRCCAGRCRGPAGLWAVRLGFTAETLSYHTDPVDKNARPLQRGRYTVGPFHQHFADAPNTQLAACFACREILAQVSRAVVWFVV